MRRYAEILATRAVQRGLVGPREADRIWTRHIANCAVVAEEAGTLLPRAFRVADVGSGAGLPGVVWALVRPDLSITLVEPLLRRTRFLNEVVDELGLGDRVTVVRSRAEDVTESYPVVTARAVARLDQLVTWVLPRVEPGGWLIALKGAGAEAELDHARPAIRRMGGVDEAVLTFGADLAEPTTVVAVRRSPEAVRSA